MNLIYQQINKHKYSVRTNKGKWIGDLIMDVDGQFCFWPEDNNCAWSSYHLRELAYKMDEIIKQGKEQVEKELNK